MLISELMKYLDSRAPLRTAEGWDNVGLLVGDPQRVANKALVAMDVTPAAARKALEAGADLIVSHHPLIFNPLKQISDPLLLTLIENKIAVICLHTNLDVAPGGVNQALADALGLEVTGQLSQETGSKWHHVVASVPAEQAWKVAEAAFAAGAGRIGNYASCSTRHQVSGTFLPLDGAKPFTPGAQSGKLSEVDEAELEFMADDFTLPGVLAAINASHPYETPLIYHFPVANANPAYALGLLGKFPGQPNLEEIAGLVKERLRCPHPILWRAEREPGFRPRRIAVCGGAGASLLSQAQRGADLYITGDLGYHRLLDSTIPLIDAGHFHTEFPVLERLAAWLSGQGLASFVLPQEEHDYPRRITVY